MPSLTAARLSWALVALSLGCDLDLPPRAPLRAPMRSPPSPQVATAHTLLGAPVDGSSQDEIVLRHPQFTVSYNRFRNDPNWVAWRLRADDLGHTGRTQDRFSPDPMLPEGVYAVHHGDYSGSGFDRGHLCPSSARTADPQDNAATFVTTNLLPQKHGLNAGAWEAFELWCNDRARQGNDVYVLAGGLWDAACATDRTPEGSAPSAGCPTIGRSPDRARRVAVPRGFWKVAVVLERDQGARDVRDATEVVAVEMPNDANAGADWRPYVTSVDAVERDTGYELLSAVAPAVQRVIEARAVAP